MKRSFFLLLLACSGWSAYAQDNNYEALARQFSQTNPQGTARMMGIGGSHSAIGADLSTLTANPAGLGMYTRSELSITGLYNAVSNTSNYLGNSSSASANGLGIGNAGVVFSGRKNQNVSRGAWRGGSWGLGYSANNQYLSKIRFGGENQGSSMVDYFAEQTNKDAQSLGPQQLLSDFRNDLAQHRSVFDYPTTMYYYGLLVEPTSAQGTPYIGAEAGKRTNQDFTYSGTGRTGQWTLGYGGSYLDRLYLGFSVGYATMNFTSDKMMDENFVSPVAIRSFRYRNALNTTGRGFNFSAGFLYKPSDFIRFGAAITSPTSYTIRETASQFLDVALTSPVNITAAAFPDLNAGSTNLINDLQSAGYGLTTTQVGTAISSVPSLSVLPFEAAYRLRTPLKANAGVAVFIGKQGFISGDVELLNYQGMRLTSNDANADGGLRSGFYTDLIKSTYRNTLNVRLGGEYRFGPVTARAGFAYYQDPYQRTAQFNNLDRSRKIFSGGLGYRSERFFVDAALQAGRQQTAYAPYILANTQDYASSLTKTTTLTGIVSVGTFF